MITRYIYKHLCLLACLIFVGSLFAQVELDRTESYAYDANSSISLEINNRHGDVVLENWDEAQVSIEISISVRDKKAKNAQQVLNDIDFEVSNSERYITIETLTNKSKNGPLSTLMKDVNLFNNYNIDIDYLVKIPKNIDLEITNKFGSVVLPETTGDVEVKLSYGDLRCVNLIDPILEVGFGKIKANKIEQGKLTLKNSSLSLKEVVGELDLVSNNSNIEIDVIDELDLESRRDKIEIEKINSIQATASFTDISIDELTENLDVEITYGSLEVDEINANFNRILIEQKASDVDLNIEDLKFRLDGEMDGGSFIYPKTVSTLNVEYLDMNKNIRTIKGNVAGTSNLALIKVIGNKGTVSLNE